jgi:uncharacterized protein (DUF2336 family)
MMAYGVQVRRATGFPIIQGVLDALFEHDQEVLDEAVQVWKARVSEQPPASQEIPSRITLPATDESRLNLSASQNAQDVSKRFPTRRSFLERSAPLHHSPRSGTSLWML